MALTTEFKPLALEELRREAAVLKADGWRFIQTHAANGEDGIDLYYSFMKDGHVDNYRISGVKDEPVPSITDLFLAAFVFENEARELFGVNMQDIAIDFQGGLYAPAIGEPMTIITPEMKAARDKAAKVAAAKAAKAAGGDTPAPAAASGKRVFVMTPELQARLDAKWPKLSDEKKAKVEAALKARAEESEAAASGAPAGDTSSSPAPKAAEAAPAPKAAPQVQKKVDADLEAKLAAMDPAKAAKVRAALEGKNVDSSTAAPQAAADETAAERMADEQLEQLISLMDNSKAAVVRAALDTKGGE